MTAPLSAESARPNIVVSDERVEKLKAQVQSEVNVSKDIAEYRRWADLLAILDSCSSLRAENERLVKRLREEFATSIDNAERFQKAEAELDDLKKELSGADSVNRVALADLDALRAENERLRAEFSTLKKAYDDECAWRGRGYRDLLTRAEQAAAELAKQVPLIQAVMGAEIRTHEIGGSYFPNTEAILRAALKYREEQGK
jgi:DNA repair exonuclease SbcCD ATPase subunit